MKIAILDVSYWPPEYMEGHPKFGACTRDWLAQGLPDADYHVIDIQGGASVPDPKGYDGFVVTGSEKGVYDAAHWMADLRALLIWARDARAPVLGLCFGHQIMADVWGGKAELSDAGPQIGVRDYLLNGEPVKAHAWHKDQVTVQPPQSRVIAAADYCPIAGLAYDFPALSVQFHPEYTRDYMGGFIRRGRGSLLDEARTDTVLAELHAHDVAEDLFAREAGAMFRRHLGGAI